MVLRANKRKICRKASCHKGQRGQKETNLMIRKRKKDLKLKNKRESDSSINKASRLSDFKHVLLCANPAEQDIIEATRGIRQLSAPGNEMQVRWIVDAEIIPLLVRILNSSSHRSSAALIYEAEWALSNIAYEKCAYDVANSGAIRPLVQLLRHNDAKVQEQSAWCLGNIAGEGQNLREQILNESGLHSLMVSLVNAKHMTHLGSVIFAIANLCNGIPASYASLTADLFHRLLFLLDRPIDEEISGDVLWAISYILDGDKNQFESVITNNLLDKLINFLENDVKCKEPIVQVLVNFVSGSDSRTQIVCDSGILDRLPGLLSDKPKGVRKISSCLASHIACGSHEQITQLVKKKRILHQLIEIARDDYWIVRREALCALANICEGGNRTHILSLVRAKGFEPLIVALDMKNIDIALLIAVLNAIENIFEADEQHLCLFAENKGIDYLEELQKHDSFEVYEKAVFLIEEYLGVEEDENTAPAKNGSDYFSFGPRVKGLPDPEKLFHNSVQNQLPEKGTPVFRRVSTNPSL
eukprot:jgi/Psemu1/287733/fgenesh1_pg.210_\